MKFVPVSILII